MPKKATKSKKKAVKKVKEAVEEAVEELGEEMGRITHYFDNIGVAVVELAKALKVGTTVRVKGSTTDFKQKIDSMQVEHKSVDKAKKGDAIGLKVKEKVRPNDKVYFE